MEKKHLQTSNQYTKDTNKKSITRTIYWGEVISIKDKTQGGVIKVRVAELDNQISNDDLPNSYPILPKFIHLLPKVGEIVRIFIEDPNYPQNTRFWMGSVISQLHKLNYDNIYSALSTSNIALSRPDPAPNTYPDATGIYPNNEDIALLGRKNTDIILRENDLEIRAGQHEDGDPLKLNKKNPSSVRLVFEENEESEMYSSTIIMSDKIGIISHDGIPKFKSNQLTAEDRLKIFAEGHPMVRGDVLVQVLNIFRDAIIRHIHGYAKLPADKDEIISDLQKLNIERILQENIVIN